MSIFGKIKDAILGHEAEARPTPTPLTPTDGARQPQSQAAAPIADIEQNLDSMPGADRLNWRTSIVDLMKLIGVDSSYEARKALAAEMGRTDYSGSAEDNVWLHRRVMQDLSKHGGKVPAEYTD